jgi:hypothetical protein
MSSAEWVMAATENGSLFWFLSSVSHSCFLSAHLMLRRTLDTHTSSTKAAETNEASREPVHHDLFSSKSTCLHDELSTMWKSSSVVCLKRTMAPKRAIKQYFLDLGQADFSHTTCPSCGLVYARGEYTDEKLHTSFHKNQVQGIQFRVELHCFCSFLFAAEVIVSICSGCVISPSLWACC